MVVDTASRVALNKKTNQGRHTQDQRAGDFYPTPAPLTRALTAHWPLPPLIWEPAAGRGDMAAPLQAAGHRVIQTDITSYGTRLDAVGDFFDFEEAPEGAACIVTNPPFYIADRFVRHGLKLCPTVIILQRILYLEGKGRSDLIDHHLDHVLAFIERPPMMHRWSQGEDGIWREWQGKKSSSAMPFAWFIFKRDLNKQEKHTTFQRISWRTHTPLGCVRTRRSPRPSESDQT
jgi:hypothetical protein